MREAGLVMAGVAGIASMSRLCVLEFGRGVEAALSGRPGWALTTYGSGWVSAMDRIEQELGGSEPYLLVDAGSASGELSWVRFRLAPRKGAVLGVERSDGALVPRSGVPRPLPFWTLVVPAWPKPPELLPSYEVLSEKPQILERWSDRALAASIETIRVSARSSELLLVVRCAAGAACDGFRLYVWGRRMDTLEVESEGLDVDGTSTHASKRYRLRARLPRMPAGEVPGHLVVTSGRRFRCLPRFRFRWS